MKKLTGNQIRKMFLEYFSKNGHIIEDSASLIPINDGTLLWINAGVAALKKYFDGREKPRCNRITNAQKSIRTNDIENVGKTARHHTFFEMLGNFSIGDYFKEDALKFAWEFLTSKEYIGFDKDRIYITVYPDDIDAYDIWVNKIGVNPKHILKSKENFWQIGEGPSGPCSEIFYDRGEKYDPKGLGEKLFFEELDNDRYIEVWNIVFSQYDAKDGVDRKDYKELPQKNIDTGMGLERLTALVQDGETNFDTDLFLPIIKEVEKFAKNPYQNEYKMAYRVIADHIRTVVFALSDGATFSNEGRGYVLRRILRRAIRFNIKLGIIEPFMFNLVDIVVENMKDFYPYLVDRKEFVKTLINKEEKSFYQTLKNGEKILEEEIEKAKIKGILDGEVIFKLYDTYGYPKEITFEVADDLGIKIDYEGFNKAMDNQKELARSSRNVIESMQNQSKDLLEYQGEFEFSGYHLNKDKAKVLKILKDGMFIETLTSDGAIILNRSCFYAESGGQIADTGFIYGDGFKAEVLDVKKAPNSQFIHYIKLIEGTICVNDNVELEIDEKRRSLIRANHSSLHLLHSALINVLGKHIAQAGSYVCDKYARFDFFHYEKISFENLKKIEAQVNEYISASYPITTKVLNIEEAKKEDAIALFDEKYEDVVRVVDMGGVSKEFCGGTHANNTSELNLFKIVYEESVGSGIRRIECKTKQEAYNYTIEFSNTLENIKDKLKLKSISAIDNKIDSLINNNNELNKVYNELNLKYLNLKADELINKKEYINDVELIFSIVEKDIDLKTFASIIKNKNQNALIFLVSKNQNKLTFICVCALSMIEKGCKAGDIIKYAASISQGKGGGKDDLAQGGGDAIIELDELLTKVKDYLF